MTGINLRIFDGPWALASGARLEQSELDRARRTGSDLAFPLRMKVGGTRRPKRFWNTQSSKLRQMRTRARPGFGSLFLTLPIRVLTGQQIISAPRRRPLER